MTEGPKRATDVARETDKSPEQIRREKTTKAVRGRQAQREALRRAGADVPTSSPDLYARLEDGKRRIDRRVSASFRASKVVADRLGDKR